MCAGESLDDVVIEQARVVVNAILHGVIQLARKIHLRAMCQVPAVGKAHTEHGIAGITQGHVRCSIGL